MNKIQKAWAMYDWSNSAYNLVITSTIFPAYYKAVSPEKIQIGNHSLSNNVVFDYTLAFAYLLIAFMSPILSSMADVGGNKKRYMQFFTYIGSIACMGLFYFTDTHFWWGISCFAIAAIGFCGSLVFYNAYLPEIATKQEQDSLSALGFTYGYIGSVLLQIICLTFIMMPSFWHIPNEGLASRISFFLVGVWWLSFSQIPFRLLPKSTPSAEHKQAKSSILKQGFKELKKVLEIVKKMPVLKNYLAGFFFYSLGVQTVMLAATLFATSEITKTNGEKLGMQELIIIILIIQLVAIVGSTVISKLSMHIGNIKSLMIAVIIWIGVCIGAYNTHHETAFYCLAAVVGLIMGGIQSLSRSTYSKLMPATQDTSSFFSFYDVSEKIAIVIGMFAFGFIEHITGSMRNSILLLILFFLIGFVFLTRTLQYQKSTK